MEPEIENPLSMFTDFDGFLKRPIIRLKAWAKGLSKNHNHEIIPATDAHGAWILSAQSNRFSIKNISKKNGGKNVRIVTMLTRRERVITKVWGKVSEIYARPFCDHGIINPYTGKNDTVRGMLQFQKELGDDFLGSGKGDVFDCFCMAGKSRSYVETIIFLSENIKVLSDLTPEWWEKIKLDDDVKERLKNGTALPIDIAKYVKACRPEVKDYKKMDGDQAGFLGLIALSKVVKKLKESNGKTIDEAGIRKRTAENVGLMLQAPLDIAFRDEKDVEQQKEEFLELSKIYSKSDESLLDEMVKYNTRFTASSKARAAIFAKMVENDDKITKKPQKTSGEYAEEAFKAAAKKNDPLTAGDKVELLRSFGEMPQHKLTYENVAKQIITGSKIDKYNTGIQTAELFCIAEAKNIDIKVIIEKNLKKMSYKEQLKFAKTLVDKHSNYADYFIKKVEENYNNRWVHFLNNPLNKDDINRLKQKKEINASNIGRIMPSLDAHFVEAEDSEKALLIATKGIKADETTQHLICVKSSTGSKFFAYGITSDGTLKTVDISKQIKNKGDINNKDEFKKLLDNKKNHSDLEKITKEALGLKHVRRPGRKNRGRLYNEKINEIFDAGLDDFGYKKENMSVKDDGESPEKYGVRLYKKDGKSCIAFNTATDNNPKENAEEPLKSCAEIFDYIKKNETFKKTINQAIPDENGIIRVYIPIITVYGPTSNSDHAHYRGLYLDIKLDDQGHITVPNACLVDSRNEFFGGFCPTEVKKDIQKSFPECKFTKVFTGHQSVIARDNDSCGYRMLSYFFQLVSGVEPSDLHNEEYSKKPGHSFDSVTSPYNNNGSNRKKSEKPPTAYEPNKKNNRWENIKTAAKITAAVLFFPVALSYFTIQYAGRKLMTKTSLSETGKQLKNLADEEKRKKQQENLLNQQKSKLAAKKEVFNESDMHDDLFKKNTTSNNIPDIMEEKNKSNNPKIYPYGY